MALVHPRSTGVALVRRGRSDAAPYPALAKPPAQVQTTTSQGIRRLLGGGKTVASRPQGWPPLGSRSSAGTSTAATPTDQWTRGTPTSSTTSTSTTPAPSATTTAAQNADIEDLFEVDDYLELFNTAMSKSLKEADLPPGDRIVRRIAEKIGSDFEHGDPADYFLRHRDQLLPTRPLLADLPRTRRLPRGFGAASDRPRPARPERHLGRRRRHRPIPVRGERRPFEPGARRTLERPLLVGLTHREPTYVIRRCILRDRRCHTPRGLGRGPLLKRLRSAPSLGPAFGNDA